MTLITNKIGEKFYVYDVDKRKVSCLNINLAKYFLALLNKKIKLNKKDKHYVLLKNIGLV